MGNAGRPSADARVHASDLPLVSISQGEIDKLEARYPTLADVWSLTSLQQGMLFHAVLAESSTSLDVYTSQLAIGLGGVVDADRMRAAAQALVDRYPNLRAGFVHDEHGNALQVVVEDAPVQFRRVDLTGFGADEMQARRQELLEQDRVAGST